MRTRWIIGVVLIAGAAAIAWSRGGLLDLPPVPKSVTLELSGLAHLEEMRREDSYLRPGLATLSDQVPMGEGLIPPIQLMREALRSVDAGDEPAGLDLMRQAIRQAPSSLVLGNAYRMTVFRLRRGFLHRAKEAGSLTPEFPTHLDHQPVAFFEELDRARSTRETQLQLALTWVDEMLLFPALEIKAPASVQAVNILTETIERDPAYVPALFARGLNHLHRPARLVWPEAHKTALDAAAQDIGRCVAIGRKLNVGSKRLHATLAMTLGDAYVKAGRLSVARSWWQIAQNLSHDDDLQQAIRRRYGWPDELILDRLEEELDHYRGDLDRPMTDLAMMWN